MRRSIYDRAGQVWFHGNEHLLVVESTTSKYRRKVLHRCFRLENGTFFLLNEAKAKRLEWISWMTRFA